MKKITAMILGSSLALSLAIPFTSMANDVYSNEQDVEIHGTIEEAIIVMNVKMPLTVPFAVETIPGKGVVSKGAPLTVGTLVDGNEAVLCAMHTIENNSSMGIKVDVVDVKDKDGLLNDINIALSKKGNPSTNYLNGTVSKENPIELLSLPKVGIETFKVVGSEIITEDNTGAAARKIVEDGTRTVTTTLRVTPVW